MFNFVSSNIKFFFFFFQAEDGIRDHCVTGVQTCALPISPRLIGVLENLGSRADEVLIGGKMAEDVRTDNPFSFEAVLPQDVVAASSFDADADTQVTPFNSLPDGWLGLDIGPTTSADFARRIAGARTVFWNGPMGVFEWPKFAEGTFAVARALAESTGVTVVGGGDSGRAGHDAGVAHQISWISTGGGAP